jgi:hypothetical protein
MLKNLKRKRKNKNKPTKNIKLKMNMRTTLKALRKTIKKKTI